MKTRILFAALVAAGCTAGAFAGASGDISNVDQPGIAHPEYGPPPGIDNSGGAQARQAYGYQFGLPGMDSNSAGAPPAWGWAVPGVAQAQVLGNNGRHRSLRDRDGDGVADRYDRYPDNRRRY
jgi:hypothetical protein